MPTFSHRRIVAGLTALASGVAMAVAPFATGPAQADTVSTVNGTTTYYLSKATSTTDYANIERGQYRWLGGTPSPSTWPARDIYYRDQVYWGRLERTKGVYDFSWIEDGLNRAGAVRGKFGFRVMAYCPGCWMESRTDKVSFPPVTPSFIPLQPGTNIPDWNSETFLSSWERLMAALGAKYGTDKRLGSIDIGGYGMYGEWWVPTGTPRITDANALRMVAAVNKAFPTKTILFNTMTSVDLTLKALATNPRMGLRTDSLGVTNMNSMAAVDTRLQSVWKTRPFYTEWASNGDAVKGRDQVKAFHISTLSSGNLRTGYDLMTTTQKAAYLDAIRSSGYRYWMNKVVVGPLVRGRSTPVTVTMTNLGVAPTYSVWRTEFRLTNSAGARVWTRILWGTDLKTVLPGSKTGLTSIVVPTTIPRGTYQLSIGVKDQSGYSPDMYLANNRRRADGGYTLGTVTVR